MSERLELARAAYREIPLYRPNLSPCAIGLHDNTNLFGVPPSAGLTVVAGTVLGLPLALVGLGPVAVGTPRAWGLIRFGKEGLRATVRSVTPETPLPEGLATHVMSLWPVRNAARRVAASGVERMTYSST